MKGKKWHQRGGGADEAFVSSSDFRSLVLAATAFESSASFPALPIFPLFTPFALFNYLMIPRSLGVLLVIATLCAFTLSSEEVSASPAAPFTWDELRVKLYYTYAYDAEF